MFFAGKNLAKNTKDIYIWKRSSILEKTMFETLKLKYQIARMTTDQIMSKFEKFEKDESGEAPVKALFMLFILAVLAGALVPTAIASLKAANTSEWTTSEIATYGIITIMVLIAVVMLIARIAME